MTKLFRGRRVKFTKTQKGWWLEDEGVIANDRKRQRKPSRESERAVEEESVFASVMWVQACFVRQSEVVISQ